MVNASVDSSIDGNGDGIKDGSPIQPNNISKSQTAEYALFPLLALDTSGPVVTSTDPINGATEVPLDKVITATFNETVQSSTVNSSHLYTKNWQSTVPGSVSLSSDGLVATFKPSDPLISFTSYVANVTTGVKGTDGNPLQTEEVWSFTTVDTSPPDTVIDSSIDGNGDDLKDGKKTDSDTMSFTFSSNKANSTFECSRDGSSFKKCDEEFTL